MAQIDFCTCLRSVLATVLMTGAVAAATSDDAWQPFGTGVGLNNTVSWGIAGTGNSVYVSGNFTSVDGVPANRIACWDGTGWAALGSGLSGGAGDDIVLASGTVYVVGQFTSAGGIPANHVAAWNGSSWSALGAGVPDFPYAATLYNGDLYVAGGSPPWVRKWDGSAWTVIGTGSSGWVYNLTQYGSMLTIGGDFSDMGGVGNDYLVTWDGTTFSKPGGGVDANAETVAVDGGSLYVSGKFLTAGGVACTRIAKWDGSVWSALGSGLSAGNAAMVPGDGGLYVFGAFTDAGGVTTGNSAFWDGSTWSPLGSGTDGPAYLATSTTQGIVVAGQFSSAGAKAARGVAIYNSKRIAFPGSFIANIHTPTSGVLLAVNASNNPIPVSIVRHPHHGTVVITNSSTGAYTYTGNSGFSGSDDFTFIGSDSGGTSNVATIAVTVRDIEAPALAITTPSTYTSTTNASTVYISGTTSDNIGVTDLYYVLTGSTTASGLIAIGSPWGFTTPALTPGATTVTITVLDAASNSRSTSINLIIEAPESGGGSNIIIPDSTGKACGMSGGISMLVVMLGLLPWHAYRRSKTTKPVAK